MTKPTYQYDVVISFAGEDRAVAKQIASRLTQAGVKVFYDEYELANLWGKDLYEHLSEVYSKMARFCIMLISKHYSQKNWTSVERKSAQTRAFQERSEYILPVRLDDTVIPGIQPTVGYLDYRQHSIEDIVQATLQKLGQTPKTSNSPAGPTPTLMPGSAPRFNIPLPKVTTKPTQRDRDRLLRETFSLIRQYFEQALQALESHNPSLETDLADIHAERFVCTVYRRGEVVNKCLIWIGGLGASNSIAYFEGPHIRTDENAMNECLSLEEQQGILGWKPMMFLGSPAKQLLAPEEAARYLWEKFISRMG